ARAVRADDAEDFAAPDLQIDAAHGLQLAVAFAQAANADRGLRPFNRPLIAPVNSGRFTIKLAFHNFQYCAHRFSSLLPRRNPPHSCRVISDWSPPTCRLRPELRRRPACPVWRTLAN